MDRRGLSGWTLKWPFYFFLTALIIVFFPGLAGTAIKANTDTFNIEYNVLSQQVVKELSYYEAPRPTRRLGIIDFDLFEEGQLSNIIAPDTVGVKVTLHAADLDKEIFLNGETYSQHRELIGSKRHVQDVFYVLVWDGEGLEPGSLTISTIFTEGR